MRRANGPVQAFLLQTNHVEVGALPHGAFEEASRKSHNHHTLVPHMVLHLVGGGRRDADKLNLLPVCKILGQERPAAHVPCI